MKKMLAHSLITLCATGLFFTGIALSEPQKVTQNSFSQIKKSTKAPLCIGYLESWGQIKLSEAAKHYQVIVLAFGRVDGTQVSVPDIHNLYMDWSKNRWFESFKADLKKARSNGAKAILLSFGGENNTFHPQGSQASELAKNLVNFALKMGFDGFDFDLENVDADTRPAYLHQLIQAIKQEGTGRNLLITAAPQLNKVSELEGVQLVNSGVTRLYDEAVKAGDFCALFIQEYNTGGYFIGPQGKSSWQPYSGAYSEMDPEFVVTSFARLRQIIPASTYVVPGQPASAEAGGRFTIYHGASAGHAQQKLCQALKKITASQNFGGVMTWSINKDSVHNYAFAKSVFEPSCTT